MTVRWILAAALVASTLRAQGAPAKAATLAWSDLRILIAPEEGETRIWLSADATLTKEGGSRNFHGALDPAETVAWARTAREFLRQSLGSRDTGDTRASAVLLTKSGEKIFLVRRRHRGSWTHERFVALSDTSDRPPTLLDIDPFRARDLIDSLESVARRTTPREGPAPPKSVWLTWKNIRVALAPDSGGTYFWVGLPQQFESVSGSFDPANALAWVVDARALLTRRLTAADTGSFRATRRLRAFSGDGIYLERRRRGRDWSSDGFLVFEPTGSRDALVVSGDEAVIGAIVDSIDAVSRRTVVVNAAVQRDSAEQAEAATLSKPAAARPGNQAPMYPAIERGIRRSGAVLLSFVIGTDGVADLASVRVIHATSAGFQQAVLDALPKLRFFPAERDGVAVRARVVMPFQFSVTR